MLLADADPFWKPPTVYDAVGVVGFVFGLLSIWLALRDIQKRIRQARAELRAEAERQAREQALAAARHALELTREAAASRSWRRAAVYAEMAADQLARIDTHHLPPNDGRVLFESQDFARRVAAECRGQPRDRAGRLSTVSERNLERALAGVGRLEARARFTTEDQ